VNNSLSALNLKFMADMQKPGYWRAPTLAVGPRECVRVWLMGWPPAEFSSDHA
jgi:hypothetical protein